jgi:DNA-binding MarR family transcriptional regulator
MGPFWTRNRHDIRSKCELTGRARHSSVLEERGQQMSAPTNELRPERLLELSDQVSRIASSLARLSAHAVPEPIAAEAAPAIAPQTVRAVLRARRLRARYFDEELFADPAWDMMLDLFEAELSQRRVSVSSLCVAAAVPATTALRWLKSMVEKDLLVRRADPFDARRVYVELSPNASEALRRYFAEIENTPTL